jgi:hypothetical protein
MPKSGAMTPNSSVIPQTCVCVKVCTPGIVSVLETIICHDHNLPPAPPRCSFSFSSQILNALEISKACIYGCLSMTIAAPSTISVSTEPPQSLHCTSGTLAVVNNALEIEYPLYFIPDWWFA